MSEPRRLQDERLVELLAERAEHGLDEAQVVELSRLLDEHGPAEAESEDLELAAASAYLAFEQQANVTHEPMPVGLADNLVMQGEARVAARNPLPDAGPIPFRAVGSDGRGVRNPAWGWLAAAAVLVLSVATWIVITAGDAAPDYATQRNRLLTRADDVTRVDWVQPDDPAFKQVSGDVVWSDQKQQGYMRLVGMPVNDPTVEQYQLWIVDPDVDSHPVDGGVFDVTSSGEVIIPIDAKLHVDRPTVFAITVEKPGGVVVSAGPLRVVAPVGT